MQTDTNNTIQISLTEEERELVLQALLNYGDRLSQMAKEVSNLETIIAPLKKKAEESYGLVQKIAKG